MRLTRAAAVAAISMAFAAAVAGACTSFRAIEENGDREAGLDATTPDGSVPDGVVNDGAAGPCVLVQPRLEEGFESTFGAFQEEQTRDGGTTGLAGGVLRSRVELRRSPIAQRRAFFGNGPTPSEIRLSFTLRDVTTTPFQSYAELGCGIDLTVLAGKMFSQVRFEHRDQKLLLEDQVREDGGNLDSGPRPTNGVPLAATPQTLRFDVVLRLSPTLDRMTTTAVVNGNVANTLTRDTALLGRPTSITLFCGINAFSLASAQEEDAAASYDLRIDDVVMEQCGPQL